MAELVINLPGQYTDYFIAAFDEGAGADEGGIVVIHRSPSAATRYAPDVVTGSCDQEHDAQSTLPTLAASSAN